MKLIYVSHTRLPSERANSYQSIQMCSKFSEIVDDVYLWIPRLRNKGYSSKVSEIYDYYGINNNFHVCKISTIDSKVLSKINLFIWANVKILFFGLGVFFKILKIKDENVIIYTRDWFSLRMALLARNIFMKRIYIFYESHEFSKRLGCDLKKIEGLIVINNNLKKMYANLGIKNIMVAHDGVNLDEYTQVRDYSFVKKKMYRLVYTGSLFPWKGVDIILDSLKFVISNVELFIIGGSGESLKRMKGRVKENNTENIKIVGHIKKSDTLKYIEMADILLLPNSKKYDMSAYTSPIKLFEYMAAKRPIIASRIPSLMEILIDKKNSILFESDNPKDLAKKIDYVLSHDCSGIVNQSAVDVRPYSWKERAENIVDYMNSCIKNKEKSEN